MTPQSQPSRRLSKKALIAIIAGGVLLLCICGGIGVAITGGTKTPTAVAISNQQAAPASTQEMKPTLTRWPTHTQTATHPPLPTWTPFPNATPAPTETPTPAPQPVKYEGKGSKVLDLKEWSGTGLLKITNNGGGNFAVWTYDSSGEKKDLIVNTIGSYSGTRPLNFLNGDNVTRLQIEGGGSWTIEIDPLTTDYVRTMDIPGEVDGKGDDVVFLISKNIPDGATIKNTGDGNFAVWSMGAYRDLIVNEIGNYEGEVIVGGGTTALIIESDGTWTINITAK